MPSDPLELFSRTVWDHYRARGRHDLPWRLPEPDGSIDPCKVLVSEVMLQQTQVLRVIPKFVSFMAEFPSFEALAAAPLAGVLRAWSGLGYNRRAKFLWQAAQQIMIRHKGTLPGSRAELLTLPGIGPGTAGALQAYAYNRPAVFIETNIRTVFIHHFFADKQGIADRDILDLVARTLPDNPREWYWALMDYGTYLKQTIGNLNTLSKHYAKQSTFQGSRRQVRGQALRLLGSGTHTLATLQVSIADSRLGEVLDDLVREGLIQQSGSNFKLSGE